MMRLNYSYCCQVVGLIVSALAIANADFPGAANRQVDEKVQIYTKLYNTDQLDPVLSRAEVLDLLKKGRHLEEATPNGGRTTLEDDLIWLGSEVGSDHCLEMNLFPKISWLKRRFNEAPSILNFLEEIEREQLHLCRESFPTDYAMTMVKLNPRTRVELRELSKKVGSMGVYLNEARDIPEQRLIEGVVANIIEYRKHKDTQKEIGVIGDDGKPIISQPQKQQSAKTLVRQVSSLSLTRDESKQLADEFFNIYKKLTKDCDTFLKTMGPLMQVAQALGEQVLDLDATLRDLEKDKVVCHNLVSRPQLVGKMGDLFLDKLNKERRSQATVRLEAAPKASQPLKKHKFGSFKFNGSS